MTPETIVDILLVEDDPHDAELALRALKKANVSNPMHHVKDGAEALDYLFGEGKYAARSLANRPRVVLLDLKLPKVSGLEVLERVKQDPRTRQTPVVVLTSSNETPDIDAAYRLGANSYIVKPVEFEKFTEALGCIGWYWLLLNQPPAGP